MVVPFVTDVLRTETVAVAAPDSTAAEVGAGLELHPILNGLSGILKYLLKSRI